MLKRRTLLLTLAAACLANGGLARADGDTIRVGLIATYSGAYADYGRQIDDGIAVYLKEHGGKIAGKKVEIIKRDNEGAKPDLAKRLAQELVVRDKVNFLAGLDFSPNAYAVASVATQAKIPTIVMNAASSGIPKASPYIARVSFTVEQVTSPMAKYMLKNGIKSAYTVVADYAPGVDAEAEFIRSFTAGGGKMVGAVRTPMSNPDFSAFVQRIKDSQPQAVFFFFPSGQMPISFLKVWKERGLDKAGVKLFATGEATDDSFLDATGDVALNLVTSHHYSHAHPSPLNKRFIKNFTTEFGTALRPNYFAVAAYDGMAALAAALEKTGGDVNGTKVMEALKGLKLESPRGPIEIDAASRDIVQTVYIRNTERVDGKLVNVEKDQFERVKDPLHDMPGVAH